MKRPARLPALAECRDCAEPIRFVTMPAVDRDNPPRRMPVNPKPNDRGTVAAALIGHELHGHVITAKSPAKPYEPYRFTPHPATCEARKSTTQPAPEPHPALF